MSLQDRAAAGLPWGWYSRVTLGHCRQRMVVVSAETVSHSLYDSIHLRALLAGAGPSQRPADRSLASRPMPSHPACGQSLQFTPVTEPIFQPAPLLEPIRGLLVKEPGGSVACSLLANGRLWISPGRLAT